MNTTKIMALFFSLMLSMFTANAIASNSSMEGHDHMNHDMAANDAMDDHSSMGHDMEKPMDDHSNMNHDMAGNHGAAEGMGVIHSVSKLNRTVNLTHEPIPALKWPEMTMDLPVAKSVDISGLKSGDKVKFSLELGADKKYIITHIEK